MHFSNYKYTTYEYTVAFTSLMFLWINTDDCVIPVQHYFGLDMWTCGHVDNNLNKSEIEIKYII